MGSDIYGEWHRGDYEVMYRIEEDKDEMVEIYKTTPLGKKIWEKMLNKTEKHCANWMHASLWMLLLKEVFLVAMDLPLGINGEEDGEI